MQEIKPQIAESIPEKNCCGITFARLMFFMSAQNVEAGYLINASENIISKLLRILNNFYPETELNIWNNNILVSGNLFALNQDLDYDNLFNLDSYDECCKLTLLKSLFLINGNLYWTDDTNSNSKGYSLEFVCKENTYHPTLDLLEYFGFKLKTTTRQKSFIIYTKNSTIICDLLVKLGAVYASFEVQNSLAMREIRNLTNRQNNCFENNINKTLAASNLQLTAISYILNNYSIDYLDDSLKEVALVRLANPDVSLNDLRTLLKQNISRAGLKYRLDKIISIYQKLKGENK